MKIRDMKIRKVLVVVLIVGLLLMVLASCKKGVTNPTVWCNTIELTDTTKIGNVTIRLGNKPRIGDKNNNKTTLWGNKDFYNTPTHHPFALGNRDGHSNDVTEPSWFVQVQYEFNEDTYLGLHINKEKFGTNKNKFGFAGPTDIGLSYGLTIDLTKSGRLAINVSIASGITIGAPRFQHNFWLPEYGTMFFYSDRLITLSGYERIGRFTTLVTRFDMYGKGKFNLFAATTFNYRHINSYRSNVGLQHTGKIYSFGINIGVGYTFNQKSKKGDIYLPRF